MLELVEMANVKKKKPSFTIMPICLGITFSACRDPKKHEEWSSLWHTWAEEDSRIDVKDWESALQLFGPTNALKYNSELGEVKLREEIVGAICDLVPSGTRFEDSHIQGRERLCQVIHENIKESKLLDGVHIVGLYGIGGIGKTTICKAMCNDLSKEYRNKVAHVVLGSLSEKELLEKVLKKLTDKRLQHLGAMDVDEYRHHLTRDMMNAKVFLAIDNVSSETRSQALTLLRATYGPGSAVLVTARSIGELMALQIDESACMEMPELEMEEARSLFVYHAGCVPSTYLSNKEDSKLISSCVERCHFPKGDGISFHYHPLALEVLGKQLGCLRYDSKRWWFHLEKPDFLNPSRERQHPIFSILRRSFDSLNSKDQLLFMDVALFSPFNINYSGWSSVKWNRFEWLAMVQEISVEDVKERLENLKRKSVLENLGDGFDKIGMHDLWREFARLETKIGKFEEKQCMYEDNALEERNLTNGGCFRNMRRMCFSDEGFSKVKDVNFSCFPNVAVLKLNTSLDVDVDLDLRSLKHLKILVLGRELFNQVTSISHVRLGSLLKLGFLRWWNIPSNSPCIEEIGLLTNLQVLSLFRCGRLPDLSKLISLQVIRFHENNSVVTLTGLSSKHKNLQILDLRGCHALESCPGVDELVMLQELCLHHCSKLEEMPSLQKLKRLRKLDVDSCSSLRGLPGLGDLVSLVELVVANCWNLVKVPNICNLRKLRTLKVSKCVSIKSLPGLEELVCLQSLEMLGMNFKQLPNVEKLTNLQILEKRLNRAPKDSKSDIDFAPQDSESNVDPTPQALELDLDPTPQASTEGRDLIVFPDWDDEGDEFHYGPNLCKLTKLKRLHIDGWQGGKFSSLVELVMLKCVTIYYCKGMRLLPDLQRLSRLWLLELFYCEFEDLSGLTNATNLEHLVMTNCNKLESLPNLRGLLKLVNLRINGGVQLRDVRNILGLKNLELLRVVGHPWLHQNLGSDLQALTSLQSLEVSGGGFEDLQWLTACSQLRSLECQRCPIQVLPDLVNFPELVELDVQDCVNLTKLTCTRPMSLDFSNLDVSGCTRLQTLPDFTNSHKMEWLNVMDSGVLLSDQDIQDMKVRWPSLQVLT